MSEHVVENDMSARTVTLRLNMTADVQHVALATELRNAMHASEPILLTAGGRTADAFVDRFDYGSGLSMSGALASRVMLRLSQEIEDTHEYQAACAVVREFTRVFPPAEGDA